MEAIVVRLVYTQARGDGDLDWGVSNWRSA